MSDNYKQRSIIEIMNDVLSTIRNYYDSEYVYYIERDEEDILTIYEWCAENIPWQRDKIKLLQSEEWPKWLRQEILDTTQDSYSVFYPMENGVISILAAVGVHRGGCDIGYMKTLILKLSASILYTYIHDVLRASEAEMDDRHQLSPAVIASWKPFRAIDLELRAFYKKNYRMPTFNDLYYTFTGVSWLEPEETTQYDFGATWHLIRGKGWFRGVDVQADVYFNQIDMQQPYLL